jgi:streptogramin lyase
MSVAKTRRTRSSSLKTRRSRIQTQLETLESRTLMSVTTSFIGAVSPFGITHDNQGNVWVAAGDGIIKTDANGNKIGDTIAEGSLSYDIAFNSVDGHIYFSDTFGSITEVALDGTVLDVHTVTAQTDAPTLLTVASDGAVWFSTIGEAIGNDFSANVGRLDITTDNFSFATIEGATPGFLAAADDGSVWFATSAYRVGTESGDIRLADSSIGHAHAELDGSITIDNLYAISSPAVIPQDITLDSDGSIWFAIASDGTGSEDDAPNSIVHGVVSGDTLVQTAYVVPSDGFTTTGAGSLGLDGSGRLWFSDPFSARISYMDTATGEFTQMAAPATSGSPMLIDVTPTDIWTTSVGGTTDFIHIDLTSFEAPIASTAPNIDATVGVPATDTLVVFATADNGPFVYTIDYGNGDTATGSIIADASGVYSIPSSVTYLAAGTYDTSVTITTGSGNVITVLGTAIVTEPGSSVPFVGQGIDLTGSEDTAILANRTVNGSPVLAVATFSGPVASYSATIDFGDGSGSIVGTVVDLGGGSYAVVVPAAKVFAANGVFSGSVQITDGTNTLNLAFTTTISDTPLVASSGVLLEALKGRTVNGTVATFSDEVDSTVSWFSATINWGDGTSSSGVIVQTAPGEYTVIGKHLYKGKKATYTVSTQIGNVLENTFVTVSGTITI